MSTLDLLQMRISYGFIFHENKMRINNKGQAGPIGEDMVYMIIVVLAIAALLVVVVKAFADHEVKYAKLDMYRSALITADRISTDLAWDYEGSKRTRILDINKINCEDLYKKCKNCFVGIKDRTKPEDEWICNNKPKNSLPEPDLVAATIRLPVSIRIDVKEFHPGILEVTVVR